MESETRIMGLRRSSGYGENRDGARRRGGGNGNGNGNGGGGEIGEGAHPFVVVEAGTIIINNDFFFFTTQIKDGFFLHLDPSTKTFLQMITAKLYLHIYSHFLVTRVSYLYF